MKLPDITLPDGSMLVDRVLVDRVITKKGKRNGKDFTESRTYGYVVSTYQPPAADAGAVQRAKTGKR